MSIKVNELRVGNYFKWSPLASMGIGNDTVTADRFNALATGWNDLINPIPISAEILEKCGFIKAEHNWFNKRYFTDCNEAAEVMMITINASSNRCAFYNEDFDTPAIMTGIIIEYLHQLQNLAYAVTGEELIVNL